jgi:hypothetical protein
LKLVQANGGGSPRPCPTCGTPSAARFCAVCGERFLQESDFDFKHFLIEHLPHELFHLDGKLVRTLRCLFTSPGEMPSQYVGGRRQPYLNPLRLYLVVFLVHGFLATIGAPIKTLPERAAEIDPTGVVMELAGRRDDVDWNSPARAEQLSKRSYWFAEGGTLTIVLIVALAQKGILRRYNRRYLEHLTLALSVATFYLSVLIVGDAVSLIASRAQMAPSALHWRDLAATVLLPLYWMLGIRRFYRTTFGAGIVFGFIITAVDILIAVALNIAILVVLVEAT